MNRLPLLLALPLCALGGCDGGAPRAPKATAASPGGYVTRVRALNDGQRNGVLFRAIRDAGRTCQGVTRSEAAGAGAEGGQASPAAWVATCEDGTPWVVALADDGTATVANARELTGATGR